jgi:hypothetical protein
MTHTRAFALCLAAALFAGCAKTDTTLQPPPPDPNPQPQLASDARERIKELVNQAAEYEAGAAKLPGPSEADDRAQVIKQFALLSQILPTISGPEMTGDFRQEMRIIDSTRSQLASGSGDLAVEPTIDTGLRAAQRSITSLAHRSFSDLPDVNKAIDTMRAKNEELDGVSGAIHRLVASQSFKASAQAIILMSKALDQRLNDAKAVTKPADTKPADPAKPAEPAK